MKKIEEQIEQSELLAGKVLGMLNEEQEQRLKVWEKDLVNQKLEKVILDFDSFKKWNSQMDCLDANEDWELFVNNIRKDKKKGKSVKINFFRAIASVAAVFLVGFVSYFVFLDIDVEKKYQTVDQTSISPGSSSAHLVLADGAIVDLKTIKENTIKDGGVAIGNEKGILVYKDKQKQEALKPVVNTLIIPRGGEYQLALPDGTKVWLNSNSELTYSVPFTGNERRVKLKGEAYFDVAHNKEKPFIVDTEMQDIEVFGTAFNVSAYSEDATVVTTLVEGKVKVKHLIDEQTLFEEFLQPKEQAVLNKESKQVVKQEVDTYVYTSWKDGRFVFKNEPLESFFTKLARWYDVEVVIADETIKNVKFTGDIPRYKNMKDVLNIVEAEMSVHIKIENNKIIYVSK